MSRTSDTGAINRGIDLRALAYTALCVLPLFLGPLVINLLAAWPLDQLIVACVRDLAHGLTLAFGITSVMIAAGVLSQWNETEFSVKSYWRAVFILGAILILPYLVFFLFALARLGWNVLAPFERRSSLFDLGLGLLLPGIILYAWFSAWLYLRFRRSTAHEAERRRFLFLVAAAVAISLPPFIHHLWQGILAFTSDGSHEPGYEYTRFVSWLGTLIGSLFIGFGHAFLAGTAAIFLLKKWKREHHTVTSTVVMVAAAILIWIIAHGLELFAIWISVEGHPRWDYWPTQQAVIVLAALIVGGVAAGVIYPRILQRA